MTSEMSGGWAGLLAALWNADGLEAWTAKLIGLLVLVFALTALFSLGFGGKARMGKPATQRTRRSAGEAKPFKPRVQNVPAKNRRKKPERIVRRYKPRSHPGALRPLTRRVSLKLVEPAQGAWPLQPALRRAL